MKTNIKTLLSALTLCFFAACSPLSVDGDLPVPELSSSEALTLCEDIEEAGPMDCNEEGESEKWLDFDVGECQDFYKSAPEGCSMTAEEAYMWMTEEPCERYVKAVACFNGK